MRKQTRGIGARPGVCHRIAMALACLLALLFPAFVVAQADIAPLTSTSTVNWVTGDVVANTSFCVESFDEAADKKSTFPIPYRVTASIGGAATPFSLANAAGATIPATLTWTDLVASTTTTLAPAVSTPLTMTGKVATCPGGNNARLTITVTNAVLGAAAAGTYTRTFTVVINNNGGGRKTRTATVTLSIVIPATIRISNVSDFALGVFDTVNDLVTSDTMCVYRTTGTLFGITATGSGAGGAFTLASGARTMPYQVTWQDTLGSQQLTAGVQLSGRGNAVNADATCNGGATNNVTVTVRVTAATLSSSFAGNYSGVLSLMVAPQ